MSQSNNIPTMMPYSAHAGLSTGQSASNTSTLCQCLPSEKRSSSAGQLGAPDKMDKDHVQGTTQDAGGSIPRSNSCPGIVSSAPMPKSACVSSAIRRCLAVKPPRKVMSFFFEELEEIMAVCNASGEESEACPATAGDQACPATAGDQADTRMAAPSDDAACGQPDSAIFLPACEIMSHQQKLEVAEDKINAKKCFSKLGSGSFRSSVRRRSSFSSSAELFLLKIGHFQSRSSTPSKARLNNSSKNLLQGLLFTDAAHLVAGVE
jgi:hypothetical protein